MQYFAYGSNMRTGRLRVSRPIVQVRLCCEAYGAALHESEQHRCKVQEPINACTKHVPAHWWHSEGVEMSGLASPATVGMSVVPCREFSSRESLVMANWPHPNIRIAHHPGMVVIDSHKLTSQKRFLKSPFLASNGVVRVLADNCAEVAITAEVSFRPPL
jgi:hypothetical protein